jgi:hypothetical protein
MDIQSKFNLKVAILLAELSSLSYTNQAKVILSDQNISLDWVESDLLSKYDTQAFVTENRDYIIVIFRGTELIDEENNPNLVKHFKSKYQDWQTNFDMSKEKFGKEGSVHKGFSEALESVYSKLTFYQKIGFKTPSFSS